MPIVPRDELWPKLEELGEDEVHKRVAQGVYGARKLPTVEAWLNKKERDRQAAHDLGQADATESTRSATWLIAWATLALVVIGLAVWLT